LNVNVLTRLLPLALVGVLVAAGESRLFAQEKLARAQISIKDEDSGMSVEIDRKFSVGTTGLDAMKATVVVESKSYPGLGVRVLKICGVAPARGKYWALFVDGKYSELGIADVKLDKDVRIEWKTQP
jgi:hypothetical protein